MTDFGLKQSAFGCLALTLELAGKKPVDWRLLSSLHRGRPRRLSC